jgi:tetratricopeptide (TPR) repeat protein
VRLLPAALIAGVLGTSSPISPPGSPPDDFPERRTVAQKTETTPWEPRQLREVVATGDLSGALERVRKDLARPGRDATETAALKLLEARLLDRLGRGEEAVQAYRGLLEDSTVAPAAGLELHDLLVERGQFRLADRLTDPADSSEARLSPSDAARSRAYSLSAQGRFCEALAVAESAGAAGDLRTAALRANILVALGRRDEATNAYLTLLQHEAPRDVQQVAHFGLGQIARLGGARALRALEDEKATRLGPMPAAELDEGLALRALGRHEEARTRLASIAKDYPALAPTARLAIARLDEEDARTDATLDGLAAAVVGSFGDFLPLTRLADVLHGRGDEEAAIESYQQALEIFPAFPPAQERLKSALTAQGRWEEVAGTPQADLGLAESVWDRLLDGDLPYHELVAERDSIPLADARRLVLALVQIRAGFPAGAIAWTEGATAAHPLLAGLRAEALARVGRDEEAAGLWKAILETHESVLAREGLALVAARAKNRDDAVAAWEELTRRHPGQARVQRRLAAAFEAAGWAKEAKEAFERALATGWLTPDERRAAREAAEDLADEIKEEEETRTDS